RNHQDAADEERPRSAEVYVQMHVTAPLGQLDPPLTARRPRFSQPLHCVAGAAWVRLIGDGKRNGVWRFDTRCAAQKPGDPVRLQVERSRADTDGQDGAVAQRSQEDIVNAGTPLQTLDA